MLRNTIKHIKVFTLILVLVSVGTFSIVPKASALVGSQFSAGRIIDDGNFFNGSTMDEPGIQAFLNAKVPVCDTNGTQAYGSTTRAAYGAANGYPAPYTCLKDFTQSIPAVGQDAYCGYVGGGTKSAAQIIYDVSVACSISPKVLLVLLQKEQTLVTDDWPWPSEYQSATGYGCPDTAACDSTYYGFFNQVYNAAHQYQRYAKQSSTFNFSPGRTSNIQYNPSASCGGSNVYIQNQATADLYNYTPYQPDAAALNNLYGTGDSCSAYGNRNFWRLYSDWFGSPINNGLPSSATVYVANPSGKVYLSIIDNGSIDLFYVPSWDLLTAYNLTNGPIVPVTDAYIASSGTPTTLISEYSPAGSGAVYLADQGRGFHVTSYTQCINWNLPCNSAPILPVDFTNWLTNAGELPPLLINQGVAYMPVNGQKMPFARVQDIFNSGYSWSDFATVQNINVNLTPGALILTSPTAVKFASGASIYYFDGTNYRYIPSLTTLTAWGLSAAVLQPPTSSYDATPPTLSPDLTTFITDSSGSRYLVDGGQKYLLSASDQNFWQGASYQSLPTTATNSLPTTQLKPFVSSGSSIYVLDASVNQKRHIPTYGDLIGLGYSSTNVSLLSNTALDQVPDGLPKLAEGSVVGIQETGGIYVVSNGQLLHIADNSTLANYRVNLAAVDNLPASITAAYPYGATLSSLTKDPYGYYIYYKGIGYKIDQNLASDLGVQDSAYQTVSPIVVVNSGLTASANKFFINDDNGRIYYGSGGGMHYVSTYQAFLDYGGSTAKIIHVNTQIINSFIAGPNV